MLYFDLFKKDYIDNAPITGVDIPRDLVYLRSRYAVNKTKIEKYYLERNFFVKNTHIVSRFIEHLAPHLNYDTYRYLEYVDNKITYLAKHFKFTSDIEKGIVHPDHFFGNGGDEIVFADTSSINVEYVLKNWETYPCVRVISTPRNDTKLLLPLGREDGSRSGLSVVSINLHALAIKYREFMRVQYKNSLTEGAVYDKNQFVIKHVLAPMMSDIIDHMLLNKVMDKFYGREEVTPKFKHRFLIFEPSTQIDRYVEDTLRTITTKKLDFVNLLNNIQLMNRVSASELLCLPDMSGNRQTRWAMLVSRLEHMVFVYDTAVDKGRNKHFINDWIRLVTRIKNDKGLLGSFSFEQSKKIETLINKVLDM